MTSDDPPIPPDQAFVDHLIENQMRISCYIKAMVADENDRRDLLQKTNLILWENYSRYDASRPFIFWALATAKFVVRGHYRDNKRERLVFDEAILERLEKSAHQQMELIPKRYEVLKDCLADLAPEQRTILSLRYTHGHSIDHISGVCGRSIGGVKSLLLRLRRILGECIEEKLNRTVS